MRECLVIECGLKPYKTAFSCQKRLVAMVAAGRLPDVLLLLEHPHVFSLGRASLPEHILWGEKKRSATGIDLVEADRGGGVTYHGPGQLVAYPIVKTLRPDAHRYLRDLEEACISTLNLLDVRASRRPGMTGVWVGRKKIASIGVKLARNVFHHGASLNVDCDLSRFKGVVACGHPGVRQTSLAEQGIDVTVREVADLFSLSFGGVFRRAMVRPERSLFSLQSP